MDNEQKRRVIEIVIGPCTRGEADHAAEEIQSLLDDLHKRLGAAVAVVYDYERWAAA
jgi:hypothetical protein